MGCAMHLSFLNIGSFCLIDSHGDGRKDDYGLHDLYIVGLPPKYEIQHRYRRQHHERVYCIN
jgi:hypothetical protein